MQQVYLTLVSGGEVQSASYSQAAGARSVTYTQANLAHLVQAIIGMGKQTQVDSLTISAATGGRRFSRSSDGHLYVRPLAASSAPDSWECVYWCANSLPGGWSLVRSPTCNDQL